MARILVIDDEAPIRENLARFLILEGHQVLQAADGRLGLEAIRTHKPDFIFCDVMMPHLDGFEVLTATHADPELRGIPFVFLSASAEPEKLAAALQQGATGYVTKPFNLANLRQLLETQLAHLAQHPPVV
ncbi:MAG: response regulator [Rhodoferax sp.]|nr:response regulator [Rhodoferax sp.]MCF8208681.1 response regulator [Rhodoferax sp.]